MGIFNKLIFGGIDSTDYGIYITGEAVYNAPRRDVKIVDVPGRNGAILVDQGRWDNVQVTYPAGTFAESQSDFADNLAAFRNAIVSQIGYQRLTDTYHPDEYRLATYVEGLDVEPTHYGTAGEFDLVFNCQPQRFLISGETEVTVSSGDTITNPTLFDSHPLLEVDGSGNIQINTDVVTLSSSVLDNVDLGGVGEASVELDVSALNIGDPIFSSEDGYPNASVNVTASLIAISRVLIDEVTGGTANAQITGTTTMTIDVLPDVEAGFENGTSLTLTTVAKVYVWLGSSTQPRMLTVTVTTTYDGNESMVIGATATASGGNLSFSYSYSQHGYYGISSKVVLPSPVYIDLEIGEAYGEISGNMVSVDSLVILPPELPVLSSGSNTITFDNTINELKIVPRWWKV